MQINLRGPHVEQIRNMTGVPDEQWLKMAIAVYWQLLSENSDSVVRFIRDNGQVASMGLTRDADELLKPDDVDG
jgi:hypothetical protein